MYGTKPFVSLILCLNNSTKVTFEVAKGTDELQIMQYCLNSSRFAEPRNAYEGNLSLVE